LLLFQPSGKGLLPDLNARNEIDRMGSILELFEAPRRGILQADGAVECCRVRVDLRSKQLAHLPQSVLLAAKSSPKTKPLAHGLQSQLQFDLAVLRRPRCVLTARAGLESRNLASLLFTLSCANPPQSSPIPRPLNPQGQDLKFYPDLLPSSPLADTRPPEPKRDFSNQYSSNSSNNNNGYFGMLHSVLKVVLQVYFRFTLPIQ
jgi:hypothetical protein